MVNKPSISASDQFIDIQVSDSLQRHLELIHGAKPILSKKVLILGGGFAGVEVLRRLQSSFGMTDIEEHTFTIKSWNDAIVIRNHVIHQLEQAEVLLRQQIKSHDRDVNNTNNSIGLNSYQENQKERLLTFVIVGGGFAGVETAGELNDFLRDSVKDYYHNIEAKDVRVIIIQSGKRLLPEMSEELAEFAKQKLIQSGVEVILEARVTGATRNSVKIKDGRNISTNTTIWTGGVAPNPVVEGISCKRDERSGRIVVNKFLEVEEHPGVFAIGDCAFIIDPNTGRPYPPTAQHAIREGTVVSNNIISLIEGKAETNRKEFNYKTNGMMASIGKRNGVGELLGFEVQGFVAWWIWRSYYLANLPTLQKKIRVMVDWTLDFLFRRDVTMLETILKDKGESKRNSRESIK
jgi:NADH:ubiquinone reductase (H+-translocating)